MKNPNALISLAQVSKDANNPYAVFCEYIKYCIFAQSAELLTVKDVRNAVENEFGVLMPHNIILKCLNYIESDGIISISRHQIKRTGSFDIESFDNERFAYRETEAAIIKALISYAQKYGRDWTEEYARELLINVLDRNGIAFDIFLHNNITSPSSPIENVSDDSTKLSLENQNDENAPDKDEPLYKDEFFVGKFIEESLACDTVQKDYLLKICAGMMLCVGTYQIPTANEAANVPQIKGTSFFFDTRLLLRYLGCAGEAAVEAAKELVTMIQNAGGKIYYYPQTLDEMTSAFENAIKSIANGYPPRDNEMRLYAQSIKNSIAIIAAKKGSMQEELKNSQIYLKPHSDFDDIARIRFGFERSDICSFMRSELTWESQVIDNDALAIWETHMLRAGKYEEYCGTADRLPVFVTTNSQLISIALKYKEQRPYIQAISGWKQNRLPLITDVRLTCRLWSPSVDLERLSLLYLSANAMAAKRPTKRYINSIRDLAIQLQQNVPHYSGISLPEFFDDAITESVLKYTCGSEEKLNIGSFASSIAELAEFKAREQEEVTNKVIEERDTVSDELKSQTNEIITGAVEICMKSLWWSKIVFGLAVYWMIIATILFAGISAGISMLIGTWKPVFSSVIPMIIKGIEILCASKFISRPLAKLLLPRIEKRIDQYITKRLRKVEQPYKSEIIEKIKESTPIWLKCIDNSHD